MDPIRITRTARLPDPIRISRYRKAPELGPEMLFFSGGSALNDVSRVLKNYTYNSTHLITPFDSGGSSAKLRQAFNMPAIGDLRSRMIALADESVTGHPEVYQLFTYRLASTERNSVLSKQLDQMIQGKYPMVAAISNPMRRLIRNQLGYFRDFMPDNFDLRGASIGNLILTGGYLNNHRHLDPIVFLFSKLVGVLGTVRPIVNDNLHLAADLEDGSRVFGQHRVTGKETPALQSPIKRLRLSGHPDKLVPADSALRKKTRKLISKAELICYPPGSYYSSLIANLLPEGVSSAIACVDRPKVYVPNLGRDPEQIGMTLEQCVIKLLEHLRAGMTEDCRHEDLLNFILLDSNNGDYPSPVPLSKMAKLGITVIDTRLVTKRSAPHYDPELLVQALLSLT
ncbi:MAG: GAK system CofD-like protein [Thiogranum sp.]